jgi:hypothetical protein
MIILLFFKILQPILLDYVVIYKNSKANGNDSQVWINKIKEAVLKFKFILRLGLRSQKTTK